MQPKLPQYGSPLLAILRGGKEAVKPTTPTFGVTQQSVIPSQPLPTTKASTPALNFTPVTPTIKPELPKLNPLDIIQKGKEQALVQPDPMGLFNKYGGKFGRAAGTVLGGDTSPLGSPLQAGKAVGKFAFNVPNYILAGFVATGRSIMESTLPNVYSGVTKETLREDWDKQQGFEEWFFKTKVDSWQKIYEVMKEGVESSPNALPWEKKYLPVTLAVTGFALDASGFGKPGGQVVKHGLVSQIAKETAPAKIEADLIKAGVPELVAKEASAGLAIANTDDAVRNELVRASERVLAKIPENTEPSTFQTLSDLLKNPATRQAGHAFGMPDSIKKVSTKTTGVTATDEAKDAILQRFSDQIPVKDFGRQPNITGALPDNVKEDYISFLQKTKNPTQQDLNRGLELLRLDGRKVDDIAEMMAPVTKQVKAVPIEQQASEIKARGGTFEEFADSQKVKSYGSFKKIDTSVIKEEPYISRFDTNRGFYDKQTPYGITYRAADKIQELNGHLKMAGFGKAQPKDFKGMYSLDKVIDNPSLFDKYPSLKEINVVFADFHTNKKYGLHVNNTIYINEPLYRKDPLKIQSTIVHEIQHAKQDIRKMIGIRDEMETGKIKRAYDSTREIDARRQQDLFLESTKTRTQLQEIWNGATPTATRQATTPPKPPTQSQMYPGLRKQGGFFGGTPEGGRPKEIPQPTKRDLAEQRVLSAELRKEALDQDPARELMKYAPKRGENKMTLNEVLGGKKHGEFGRRGDDIVTELGFPDTETARRAFDNYVETSAKVNAELREAKQALREVKQREQFDRLTKAITDNRIRKRGDITEYKNKKGEWVRAKNDAEAVRRAAQADAPNPTYTTNKVDPEIASLDAIAQQSIPKEFRTPPHNPVKTNPASVPERIIVHATDRNQVSATRQRGSNEIASFKNSKGETKYAIRNTGIYAPKEIETINKDIHKGLFGGQSYNLRDAFFEADGKTIQMMGKEGSGPLAKIWSRSVDNLNLRNEFVSNNNKVVQQLSQKHGVKMNKTTGKQVFDALEGRKAPANIRAFTEDVRKVLDGIREEANVVRKAMGKKEIGYVDSYAPHLQETNFWSKMRTDTRTTISDNFDYILPNAKKNPHAIPRQGGMDNLETNFWNLFDSYTNSMADDIFTSQTIEQLKAVNQVVKANGAHNLSRVIEDTIRTGYVGKPAQLDSSMGFRVGSKKRLVVGQINQARNISALAGNLVWTAVVQPASLMGMTLPRAGARAFAEGALGWFTNPTLRKEVASLNTFRLKTKTTMGRSLAGDVENISSSVKPSKIDTFNSYATWLGDVMEYNLSGISGAAGMAKAKRMGLNTADQKLFSSYLIEATQSAYNKEARPRLLQNLTVRAAAPFQTFAFELYRYTKTMLGKGGGLPLAKKDRLVQFTTLMVGMYLYDQYSQKAVGRRLFSVAPFVPIVGSGADFVVDKGLQAVGLQDKKFQANARTPVAPYEDLMSIIRAGDEFIEDGNTRKLRAEITKWAMGLAGIGGASTVNRFIDGMIASSKGYQETRKGEVAFFLEGTDRLTAPIIGPYGTQAGQEYSSQFESESMLQILRRSPEQRAAEKARQEELAASRDITKQAQIFHKENKTLPREEANVRARELKETDPAVFDALKRLIDREKKEEQFSQLSKSKRAEYEAIGKLGITNGRRAEFIHNRAKQLSREEANAFVRELKELGIVTKNVEDQLRQLIVEERGIIEQ